MLALAREPFAPRGDGDGAADIWPRAERADCGVGAIDTLRDAELRGVCGLEPWRDRSDDVDDVVDKRRSGVRAARASTDDIV
jgi:hypothetical protein